MVCYAFKETRYAATEITNLYNFVWPTATALWNLRWQVDGFMNLEPEPTYQEVYSRFVLGSGIHGADVRGMHKQISWDEQKERFAEIILTNAFAIYENWAHQIVSQSGLPKKFQDRALWNKQNGSKPGLQEFIAEVNSTPSKIMTTAFKLKFQGHKKYFPSLIDNMLLCYRYFKSVRNCQMHNGRTVDKNAYEAFNEFSHISTATLMQTKETIEYYPLKIGDRAKLSLRGVVGFSDILLRLMITMDAELSGTEMAERAALKRLKQIPGPKLTLGSDPKSIERKVKKICNCAELPQPEDFQIVTKFLLDNNIVMP